MIRHALTLTALLALAAPVASAQGIAHWTSSEKEIRTLRVRGIPSPDESRYLNNLALSLGASSDTAVVQVHYRLSDLGPGSQAPSNEVLTANGVAARVGEVNVQRLRFSSADHAQRFAIYAANTKGAPTLVEVRGNRVVIARGQRVADAQDLERIRKAAWDVLPHAPGAPSVAGVLISQTEFSYESRIRNEHLDAPVDTALTTGRERPTSAMTVEGSRVTERYRGFTSSVERLSPDHVTLWAVVGRNSGPSPRIKILAESMARTSEVLQRAAEATPAPQGATARTPARTPAAPVKPLESKQGIGTIIRGIGDYTK